MKSVWIVLMCLLGGVAAADEAEELLQGAKRAREVGKAREARRLLGNFQARFYRDVERMPEALYYEAQLDASAGGARAKVSALDELLALYPESPWADRARAELDLEPEQE